TAGYTDCRERMASPVSGAGQAGGDDTMTVRDMTLVALFAALTAVCAQVSLTLPFVTSVPFTLQVFAVLAAGAILGARRAFLSQVVYILLGGAGLPVFARLHGGTAVLMGRREATCGPIRSRRSSWAGPRTSPLRVARGRASSPMSTRRWARASS